MHNHFRIIFPIICITISCGRAAGESDIALMRKIGPELNAAFRAIEPCGENYDTCMDTLQYALENAKNAADDLMLPGIVNQNVQRVVTDVFIALNETISRLKGEKAGSWYKPENKSDMKNLYNTLKDYPTVFEKLFAKLQTISKKSKLTTPKNLTKNLAMSVQGCLFFLDRILAKLDHYIHEPEEPAQAAAAK